MGPIQPLWAALLKKSVTRLGGDGSEKGKGKTSFGEKGEGKAPAHGFSTRFQEICEFRGLGTWKSRKLKTKKWKK